MRLKFFILLLTTNFPLLNFANDTMPKSQQVEVRISLDTPKSSSQSNSSGKSVQPCQTCNIDATKGMQWFLVFLPAIFFFLLFYYFMGWLKRDGYKIADALSACEPLTLKNQTKDGTGLVINSTETQVLPRSSSRLIAFLTGLAAIIIGLCLTTYYIFITVAGCSSQNLEDFWKVIAALGIGVIPYGANMWKESKAGHSQS